MDAFTRHLSSLTHPDAHVRSEAAIALGQSRNPKAIAHLVEQLSKEPELEVREDITWGLVQFGEASVQPLLACLQSTSPAVRHHSVHALGKVGSRSALPKLRDALHDPDETVRVKAIVVMGQIDAQSSTNDLILCFADDSDRVRNTVMDTLAPIAGEIVEDSLDGLRHPDPMIRENSAALLGLAGNDVALQPLCELIQDTEPNVRMTAVQALSEMGSANAVACLQQLTASDDRIVKTMATALLKRLSQN